LGVSEENIVCCYDDVAVEIYEQRNNNKSENGQEMFDVVFC